ncbi:GNAT family N-acetyltransferase [Dyella terrae]|uniref:GNAT family N-acetyltransferase n=1 Tax=Dyella terrae TaxID=522259 RepID=UPI001EFEDC66|nr:GNAT family N-acetyltransferase [Dyella terrae]ULU24585.1 GNAT family N-acetyltransferase [Dyella terrae]
MVNPYLDPELVFAWQTAHSMARKSPLPVHDRGGFRVDTHSEKEVKRWVFPQLCEGLHDIASEITAPKHYLKLCGANDELRSALPERWEIQPANYFMKATATALEASSLPDGYEMEFHRDGPVTQVHVIAPDGDVAASGCAAETTDVFIYDRIETAPDHRRKGLGVAVMNALGSARRCFTGPQLLVATEDGRGLYTRLGWTVIAPFAAATIPDTGF